MTRYDHRGGKGKLALARRQRPDPGDAPQGQDRGLVATAEYTTPTGLAIERVTPAIPVEPMPGMTIAPGARLLSRFGGTLGVDPPSSRAGEQIMLRWVEPETIPLEHRDFVARHVVRVLAILRIGVVSVRWFELSPNGRGDFPYTAKRAGMLPIAVTPDPNLGWGRCIGLNSTLRGEALVAASIAHELRHHFQLVLRELLSTDPEWMEREADEFAAEYLAKEEANALG